MTGYNVKFTDTRKTPIAVEFDSENKQDSDLVMIGRGFLEYGEQLNENLYRILENFACPESSDGIYDVPLLSQANDTLRNPVQGQLWFNTSKGSLYHYNDGHWARLASGSEYAANWGQVEDGEQLPLPMTPSGGRFSYDECIWLVSPAGHEGRFDHYVCTTNSLAVVNAKYRLVGETTLRSGVANYIIVGIKGHRNSQQQTYDNINAPNVTPTPTASPGASPTPTPTATKTPTPTPSLTPSRTPSATPPSTPGPTPSNTPAPSASPIPQLAVQYVDSARGGNYTDSVSLCDLANYATARDYGNIGCSTTFDMCGTGQCAPEPGTFAGGENVAGAELGITVSGGVAPYTVRIKDFTVSSGGEAFAASGDCMFIGGSSGFAVPHTGNVYTFIINSSGGTVNGLAIRASCGVGRYTVTGNFKVEVTDARGTTTSMSFPYTVERSNSDLLLNPSFELGMESWLPGPTMTGPGPGGSGPGWSVATSSPAPQHLTRSARYQHQVTGHSDGFLFSASKHRATPGQIKTAYAWVNNVGVSGDFTGRITLRWLDSNGGVISTSDGNLISEKNVGWKLSTATGTAPAGATHVNIVLRATGPSGTSNPGTTAFDNISIINGPPPNTPPDGGGGGGGNDDDLPPMQQH